MSNYEIEQANEARLGKCGVSSPTPPYRMTRHARQRAVNTSRQTCVLSHVRTHARRARVPVLSTDKNLSAKTWLRCVAYNPGFPTAISRTATQCRGSIVQVLSDTIATSPSSSLAQFIRISCCAYCYVYFCHLFSVFMFIFSPSLASQRASLAVSFTVTIYAL